MNLGLDNIPITVFNNVDTEYLNTKLHQVDELAEIISCVDIMNKYVDLYERLYLMDQLYKSKYCSDNALKACEALLPSTEVTIFSIGGAIIKALYNACKWVLGILGKIWKWFFSFFKHSSKDTRKDIDDVAENIPLAQNEVIGFGISENEYDKACAIFESHTKATDTDPNPSVGMKIDDYKKLFMNTFNGRVPADAKVGINGKLLKKINYVSGMKLNALGWTDATKLNQAIDRSDKVKEEFEGVLKALKSQGGDIKKIVNACEAHGYVANDFIETKGPGALNAACIVTIVVNDLKDLARLEDNVGKMCSYIKKVSKKYVNTAP